MEWEAFLASLSLDDREAAGRLAEKFGPEIVCGFVRFHLFRSLDDLRKLLERKTTQVAGLYESIDVNRCPNGWKIKNNRIVSDDRETDVIQTSVRGPNGADGYFERGFNANQQRIELRQAFMQFSGNSRRLPSMVEGQTVELVAGKGTPTNLYFTLYLFKMLGVRFGTMAGNVTTMRMYSIQYLETILHLHWLRQIYRHADLSELIAHTASVRYAVDYAIQCGYRVSAVAYLRANEKEVEIGTMMREVEEDDADRRNHHDRVLSRYWFDRQTLMKQNFDIELSVIPTNSA